jgi:hypothetical protein
MNILKPKTSRYVHATESVTRNKHKKSHYIQNNIHFKHCIGHNVNDVS